MNKQFTRGFIVSSLILFVGCSTFNNNSSKAEIAPDQNLNEDIVKAQSEAETPKFNECPSYGTPRKITTIINNKGKDAEPSLFTGDFNSDGFDDLMIAWSNWGVEERFMFEIFLNDRKGSLTRNANLIEGGNPEIDSLPAIPLLVEDFNGDNINDLFLGVAGLDTEPFPGAQNLLLLSNDDRYLIDASSNLPRLNDFPHSVTGADVDSDGDVDIYVGNMWARELINPQLLLNDGSGNFKKANHLLPPNIVLQQNGYTASEFIDVNNDSFPDLVLGDAGDDIDNEYSILNSVILMNDGSGKMTITDQNAIPEKGAPTWLALDIDSSDLNSDGFQDLVISYTNNTFVGRFFQLLINRGDGTFTDETKERLPNSSNSNRDYVYRIDLIDIDFDGDDDLLARNFSDASPTPFLFLNDGSGYFKQKDYEAPLISTFYTILDLDNDGGTDFIYANWGKLTEVFLVKQNSCE